MIITSGLDGLASMVGKASKPLPSGIFTSRKTTSKSSLAARSIPSRNVMALVATCFFRSTSVDRVAHIISSSSMISIFAIISLWDLNRFRLQQLLNNLNYFTSFNRLHQYFTDSKGFSCRWIHRRICPGRRTGTKNNRQIRTNSQ